MGGDYIDEVRIGGLLLVIMSYLPKLSMFTGESLQVMMVMACQQLLEVFMIH